MTIIAMTSTRGAPGVTTTALVTALTWPRAVLIVEADVSGSSSVKAGYFRGAHGHENSIVNLVLAQRNNTLNLRTLRGQTLPLTDDGGRLVLPGLATKAQAEVLTENFWGELASLLKATTAHGIDIIIDAGRLGSRNGPDPLLHAADLLCVVTRSGLDDLVSVRANVSELPHAKTNDTIPRCGLLLVGEGQPHRANEATKATTLPVWSTLTWDPIAAEKINGRERLLTSLARLGNSQLIRSGRAAVADLHQAYDRYQAFIGTGSPSLHTRGVA